MRKIDFLSNEERSEFTANLDCWMIKAPENIGVVAGGICIPAGYAI